MRPRGLHRSRRGTATSCFETCSRFSTSESGLSCYRLVLEGPCRRWPARRATAVIRLSRSGSRGSRKRPVDCSGNAVGRGAGRLSQPRHQPGRTGSVRRNRVWRITIAAPSSFRRKRSLTVAVRRERWCAPSSQASGFLPGDVRFVRTRSLALGALMCRVRCVLTSPRLRGAGGGQAWRALVTS